MKAANIHEWAARRPGLGPRRSVDGEQLVLTAWGTHSNFEYFVTMKHALSEFEGNGWRTLLARRLLTLRAEWRKSVDEDRK